MTENHATDRVPLIEAPSRENKPFPGRTLPALSQGDFYSSAFNLAVVIAGLGYFIDTYDFFIYNGMRVVSLTELGLFGDSLTRTGIFILNCQIFGALVGSFLWGILGDKLGRKKALLGSILIYSLGMIGTSSVRDPLTYAIVRFVTGFGVAGEVGLGATLIAETVHSSKRTYALMFFTMMGVLGVVAAGAGIELLSWRGSCLLGGIIGLCLLAFRSLLYESRLFEEITHVNIERGSLKQLLGRVTNLKRYLLCIPLLGSNFFVTGILLTLAPEVAKATGTHEEVKATIVLSLYFFSAVFGDWLGAYLSDRLKSRKLVAGLFIASNMCFAYLLLQKLNLTATAFYMLCTACGLFNMWAITGTILVEQFPTELRATATTSNINCSRATVILINIMLLLIKPAIGIINGLLAVGAGIFAVALFCAWRLPETYGRSLQTKQEKSTKTVISSHLSPSV